VLILLSFAFTAIVVVIVASIQLFLESFPRVQRVLLDVKMWLILFAAVGVGLVIILWGAL
jgi:hypothetical protein